MREMFRPMAAAVLAFTFICAWGALRPTTAQTATKQLQLTEKQVEGFIAAQKKMSGANEAEYESIARAHGFASIEELDAVEANILLVLEGLDPETKAFAEPPVQIKRRIDEVAKDRSISDADRKQALEDLNAELKSARPLQFPSNIELVRRHYDRIVAELQP